VLLGPPELRPDQPLDGGGFVDEFGVTWKRPSGGHYIYTHGPFFELEEPTARDLDRLEWPNPSDPGRYRGLAERARRYHEETDYAVILTIGVGPVHQAQFMRGYAEWLEDLILAPAFAEGLLERYTDFVVCVAEQALAEAGEYIDIVMFGDDVGTQKSTLIRPQHYRRFVKPVHKRVVEAIRRAGKPVFYHTCGSVSSLIADFIEIGVDILNPVQVSAAHMETARLKKEFGRDVAFWGAIDNQGVLPSGSEREVRAEVERRIRDLGEGGGYVLAAAHNIQADVPPENVVALFDSARG
jgi:uroporphyrinogen decarboxylase